MQYKIEDVQKLVDLLKGCKLKHCSEDIWRECSNIWDANKYFIYILCKSQYFAKEQINLGYLVCYPEEYCFDKTGMKLSDDLEIMEVINKLRKE
jgi:hypothetical protein